MDTKCTAYVGCYTYMKGNPGIVVYDAQFYPPTFSVKQEVNCPNVSSMTFSNDGRFLYAITDEGLCAYDVLEDGTLKFKNKASIKGMRARSVHTDPKNEFIYTGGFHDGKLTALRLNPDGSIGEITDNIFHRGYIIDAGKNDRPHIHCVRPTPSGNFVFAIDSGIEHVNIYKLNRETGQLKLSDIIRCELHSSPRKLKFTSDGKFMYLINGGHNQIEVYRYIENEDSLEFECLQRELVCPQDALSSSVSCSLVFSPDENYVFVGNLGNNSVCIFHRDPETGLLTKLNIIPISGEYPKYLHITKDGHYLVIVNHDSNTINFFKIDYERGLLIMEGRPVNVTEPNVYLVK